MIWNFTERTDIPKYHEDVTTYEVTRKGKHIGVLFIDPYPRESKRGELGAVHSGGQPQGYRW
jgi:Zn-dependent oligopeptidase